MRRREVIALLGGTAAASVFWPHGALAQQDGRRRRLAILTGFAEADPESRLWMKVFLEGLAKLGWMEGQALQIDRRFSAGDTSKLAGYAAELVALAPDAMLVHGSPAVQAAQRATRAIPIVFVMVADPVGAGFVSGLARPGGNTTGFLNIEPSIGSKWLELLRQIAPDVRDAAVLNDPTNPSTRPFLGAIEAASPTVGLPVTSAGVRDQADIEPAIAELARKPNTGLIVLPAAMLASQRERIIELSARHRLPAVYAFRYYAADGGLVSYGVDVPDIYRRAPAYIDRILRGENPGELPVQAPTKFEMVINLKTAKALGLNISPMLLARADEVIE